MPSFKCDVFFIKNQQESIIYELSIKHLGGLVNRFFIKLFILNITLDKRFIFLI